MRLEARVGTVTLELRMPADFFAAFVAGERAAAALLPARPLDEGAWDDAVRRASRRRIAGGLVDELRRQASDLPPSSARERHLDALGDSGATVVVTGQQTGLFLGPLYTLHKAATAVARARWLSERSGRPCIPVFWLQTEDHDWAEVSRAEVLVPSGRRAFDLPPEPPEEARVSMAERRLPPEVVALTAGLADVLDGLPAASDVAELVARHYRSGRPPGAAFAGLLSELFAEEGLVVLDPRTPAVMHLAAGVLRRALEEHQAIARALGERATELAAAGFAEQVHTRPEASLVFFHPRGPGGPRHRLLRTHAGYATPEGAFSRSELLARLETEPLSFSTSALLRPLVQDTLLPTAAYVGGPAECAYCAQLPPLHALFGLELPMIAPRARFRLLDEATRRRLAQLGLRPEDTDRPREELIARVVHRPGWLPSHSALRERLLGPLERELDGLLPHAVALDPKLERNVRKTRVHAQRGVERFLGRLERTVLARDRAVEERLDRVLTTLRPGGIPQERVYAFPGFAARVGPRALVEALVAGAGPLSPAVRSIEL